VRESRWGSSPCRQPHLTRLTNLSIKLFDFIEGGGFLGVYAENISRENMGRYHMNQVRGVGVTQ
jgi:hypothetical protein